MHDIRTIRDDPDAFDAAMARRGLAPQSADILAIDQNWRALDGAVNRIRKEGNETAAAAGKAKAAGDEKNFQTLREAAAGRKSELARIEGLAKEEADKLHNLRMSLPNIVYDDVPDGDSEDNNVEIYRWGSPREFDFDPKEHYQLPAAKGMNFEQGAKLSGARFVVLRGAMARVHRALAQFMLDTHVDQHGLREINAPVLVLEAMMLGTGQLPKFGDDSYRTTNGWWLVPTSEVSLTNTVNGDTLADAALPIRLVAHSLCFRSEAGSAGKDTAGMLRQHQFEKVEMVSITHPDASEAEHKRMTDCAQNVLQALKLPYRTVNLCTGDIGFGARRTHDIEVWLPGQNAYREISSVSTTGDFQARRMNARFKPADGGKPEFVHTLNGSGLAVGRCLIAVLENGQQADGSVDLPAALHPYLGGKTTVDAQGVLV